MEEYLRRVQSRLAVGASEEPVHAVLGGPEPDVDTVAATLCLALHLSQKEETSGRLCLPVLCGQRCNALLPGETLKFLQTVKVSESLLLWRDDVDLIALHHAGKLKLTLLRDRLLDSSEQRTLESSILRVVHRGGQRDTGDDGASFAVPTVAREIRQEAAEHIRATLGETLGEALRLQSQDLWTEHGQQWTQQEELEKSLDQMCDTTAARPVERKLQHLVQLLTEELKEFTNGETTIALTSVTSEKPDWDVIVEGLKSVCESRGLDGALLLLSISDAGHYPFQEVAVYSNNTDILNQICYELKECSNWSLSADVEARENLQVYNVLTEDLTSLSSDDLHRWQEELHGILKDFVKRRSSALKCHPSSRTSSTEGVAGSVEFSQGSSGINDMYGSDLDRAEENSADAAATAKAMTDGEEDTGGAGASVAVELVSPDSGLTTIRSSRSSKESSVLLSDDSPVGEITAGAGPSGLILRDHSNVGLSSHPPPVPPERRKRHSGRNRNDTMNELISFDPLHTQILPAKGELANAESRGHDETRAESSNLSELEELSLLYFSEKSLDSLESSSSEHHDQIHKRDTVDPVVPAEKIEHFAEDTRGQDLHDLAETDVTRRDEVLKSEDGYRRHKRLEPQLSLVTEQSTSFGHWAPDSGLVHQWNPVSCSDLQLTPPDEEGTGKYKPDIMRTKEKTSSVSRKKAILNTLTPDSSKEEDEGLQGKKDRQVELLDFWTYSAQKGFLKSDSGTTTSYPESLDMWNMTIRDDSLSPLTTPDNLSENSGSFCGVNPNMIGGASVESPPGISDCGMEMWNTTIQEDSSSTVTSPEAPENGKNLSHMGSLEFSDSSERRVSNQLEEEDPRQEERCFVKAVCEVPNEEGWRGNEHNVTIVIEAAEDRTWDEESDDDMQTAQSQQSYRQKLASEHSEAEVSSFEGSSLCELPGPGMVTSTSEYDNIGAGEWSLASSPEACGSLAADTEGLSSPFVSVTKPVHDQFQKATRDTEKVSVDTEDNQVFLFEGTSELGHITRVSRSLIGSEHDSKSTEGSAEAEQSRNSPFFMVDFSSDIPTSNYHSSPGRAAETQIHTEQLSPLPMERNSSESTSVSHVLPITVTHDDDGTATETQLWPYDGRITETTSLHTEGKRETLKYSPDSLHPASRDEARSNSDGDSSSGLEMDYIVVSGTVKETEREWHNRPKQTKATRNTIGTFSMLFHAATALQTQIQSSPREKRENTEQSPINTATEHHVVSEAVSHSQSENTSENVYPPQSTGLSQTQVEEESFEDKSSVVGRSVSPSLRYPSDNFLKTREEVYVHSQISMEDSDEGGQSPSERPCPTSLGAFQDWGSQLVRQDTSQATSDTQSPVLTNSSVSHPSSLTGTPVSESGVTADRRLGLPFSGDLMEEENDEDEREEETDAGHINQAKWTPQVPGEGEGQLASADLLSFTEELSGQQTGLHFNQAMTLLDAADYHDGQPISSVDHDQWLIDHQAGIHDASQDTFPQSLVFRGHHDAPSHLPNESAAYQWTGSHHVTQGQTQYGYNYHHIDQRTENQSSPSLSPCGVTKSSCQQGNTDVYAEFTSEATDVQHGPSEQVEGYHEDTPHSKLQYRAECSQYQDADQCHYGSDHTDYQTTSPSDMHTAREDHASYVPDGYVHFLLSRYSQKDGQTEMMKMGQSEEAAEELDNREDPPSSADVSGSSNQRRKLAAPPMNVSLDHSEGSLLSEDALDTEDEALDTGDDLDINVDELDTTDDEADSLDLNRQGHAEELNLGAGAASDDILPGRRSADDSRLWRSVVIGEHEHRIDMKTIEPYKRVISHGGYYAEHNAIIVFAACFLPDSDCDNYNHVMENLFLYVISTLELMVAEDYMIVYLNGATPRRRMPGFSWMKKCYQMIDRRLKKNLKSFIIVHPSWFIRTLLGITRPFISSKFSSKIKYVHSLHELGETIPMEYVHIPASIIRYDEERCLHRPRLDSDLASRGERRGNSAV